MLHVRYCTKRKKEAICPPGKFSYMAEKRTGYGKKAYLNDFRKDSDGKFVYQGATYLPDGNAALPALCRKLLLFAVGCVACALARGCIPAGGMLNCFYVILPYLCEVAGVAFLMYAVISFLVTARPVREYTFQKTIRRLPGLAVFTAVSAAVGIFAEGIYLILNRGKGGTVPLLCAGFALEALCIVFALLLRHTVRRAEFTRIPGSTQEEEKES